MTIIRWVRTSNDIRTIVSLIGCMRLIGWIRRARTASRDSIGWSDNTIDRSSGQRVYCFQLSPDAIYCSNGELNGARVGTLSSNEWRRIFAKRSRIGRSVYKPMPNLDARLTFTEVQMS